jgi:tetratricopeptide (TPR) repeat protein
MTPAGRYILEVGVSTGTCAQFAGKLPRAAKGQARANASELRAALAEEPGKLPPPADAVEQLEATADAVTDRVEHANKLFRAAAENRLLDADLVTGEIGALLGLLRRLDREKRYEEEIRVAKSLHGLCVLVFRWRDLVRSLHAALRAARAAGDEAGQAWALNELGALHLCAGAPKKAEECLERALELQEKLGDAAGRCATRHNLDNARRDATRPVQIGASRRLVAVGTVLGALVLFGGGGGALGFVVGDGGTDPPSGSESTSTETSGSTETETLAQSATLAVELRGNGTGVVSGEGIECGDDCDAELEQGASVHLTAEAEEDSTFARWNGVACDEGPRAPTCTLVLQEDTTAVAIFRRAAPEQRQLTVETAGEGDGRVSGEGIDCGTDCDEPFEPGTTVTLEAEALDDSLFARWEGTECQEGTTQETCTLIMEGDRTARALFDPAPVQTWTLGVEVGGEGSGTVTGQGIDCGGDCTEEIPDGTRVTLDALAGDSKVFVGWEGVACEGSQQEPSCTFSMESDTLAVARFELLVQLQIDPSGAGSASVDPAGESCGAGCLEYLSGTSVTITALPDPEWYFAGWRDSACAGWKTEPCSLTLNGGVTVQPHFDQIVD